MKIEQHWAWVEKINHMSLNPYSNGMKIEHS